MTPIRTCKDCGLCSDNLQLFAKNKESKYGRRNLCLVCTVKRNYNQPKKKEWKTDYQVKKRYGISLSVYLQRMNSATECGCCGSEDELCYDHDHVTMEFRGVLCKTCNRAIGQLGDTIGALERALAYLNKANK